ncbi:Crp/Fnr family transcriptional regulator [Baaleninema sp.]|uniref:Crp/Fnr family transcriptional regulator n=1 Tax=Baaleninema sp. TaxID=3101197 RepID=UPI003D09296D
MSEQDDRLGNQLLARFPSDVYRQIASHLEPIELNFGQTLFQVNFPYKYVYFPTTAVLSLLLPFANGSKTELGAIGSKGMFDLSLCLRHQYTIYQAVVLVKGRALKLDSHRLKFECDRNFQSHKILLEYTQARLNETSYLAACKSHHRIAQQLARWLLSVSDCAQQDSLNFTHQNIAEILGVRRASITQAANAFQATDTIRYNRGRIVILDRTRLESFACECYRKIAREIHRSAFKGCVSS